MPEKKQEKISLHRAIYEAAGNLNDEDRLKFYDALFAYGFEGIEIEIEGAAKSALPLAKALLK